MPKNPEVILETSLGFIKLELFADKAPVTVANFLTYVREGFYDGLTFHRVIDGFMAQGGCPRGDGSSGSGRRLRAEFNDLPHDRGACSMARAQHPDSADSQFFICFDDAGFLDGKYTVWGHVTSGMEHIDALKKGSERNNGSVSDPDRIVKFQVAADAED